MMEEVIEYMWLARSTNGLLTISPQEPTNVHGYWIAYGSKPFYPQKSFPQVTPEGGPVKVKVTTTLANE